MKNMNLTACMQAIPFDDNNHERRGSEAPAAQSDNRVKQDRLLAS